MAFEADKFVSSRFKDRTEAVPVPELASFFAEGEDPVWVVKCLSADELAKANDEVSKNTNMISIISALVSSVAVEQSEAIKELVGASEEKTPDDLVRRISYLISGSVSPVCTRPLALKLGKNYAVVFYRITNKILELMGKGRLGE